MSIEIDNREHQLINLLQQLDTTEPKKLQISTLEIGDIIICNKLIIERKSVADLYASILDGRYEEQGYRLSNLSTYHNHNIVYLIEGDIARHKQKNMLMSALFSINYYKGFSVMRTYTIQETADYIWNTFKKMTKENKSGFYNLVSAAPTPFVEDTSASASDTGKATANVDNVTDPGIVTAPTNATEKDYVSVVKKCKKENITENNIDEIMLCQIPGISTQSAMAIVKHLGSIREMLQKYIDNGDAIFSDIRVTQTTGKEAKLNKIVVQNLKKFLLKTG
jgi:ERCC4-type nuclease